MTNHKHGALVVRPRRISRDWKPFQPTQKQPGQWEQTRDGFVRVAG